MKGFFIALFSTTILLWVLIAVPIMCFTDFTFKQAIGTLLFTVLGIIISIGLSFVGSYIERSINGD